MDTLETSCFGGVLAVVGSFLMIWGIYICSTGNLFGIVELVIGILAIFFGMSLLHRAILKLRAGNTTRHEQEMTGCQRERVQKNGNNCLASVTTQQQVVILETRGRKPLPQIPINESISRNSTERESSNMKGRRSLPSVPHVTNDDSTKEFAEQKEVRPLPPTPEIILSYNSDISRQNVTEKSVRKLDHAPKDDICFDRERKSLSIAVKQSTQFRSNTTQDAHGTRRSFPGGKSCPVKFVVRQAESEIQDQNLRPTHIIQEQAKRYESEIPGTKGKSLVPVGSVSKMTHVFSSKVPENPNDENATDSPFYEEVMPTPLLKKAHFKTSFANRVIDRINIDKV